MKLKFTIIILFLNSFLCNAQYVSLSVVSSTYYNTYNPQIIQKNNVLLLTYQYSMNCHENTKNDTLLGYKKYFNTDGKEVKIINYKGKGDKIYSVDSIGFNQNRCDALYTSKKNKPYTKRYKYFNSDVEKSFIDNPNSQLLLLKNEKIKMIIFIDDQFMIFHKYLLSGKRMKPEYLYDYDSLINIKRRCVYESTNEIYSFNFNYDYNHFNGKSTFEKNGTKFLHSVITLGNDLQIKKENIYDVEYDKLASKSVPIPDPSQSIIYHYQENGLISFIEFMSYNGDRWVCFFKYEYYK